FLPASYSLVLALESFVGERERSTLEVLLSTPLKEAEIYVGKVASVLAISLFLCFGALIVYCTVTFPGLGYFPLGVLVSLGVSTICQVAAMVAGAVIISANARTMRAANVMASFIILPMSVVLQVEAALILVGRGELLWGFAAAMAVGAFILLRMGRAPRRARARPPPPRPRSGGVGSAPRPPRRRGARGRPPPPAAWGRRPPPPPARGGRGGAPRAALRWSAGGGRDPPRGG